MTSRVLVVGGTGILRPAVDALLAAGREVTVLGRSPERLAALPPAVTGVVGDLGHPDALAAALAAAAGGRPDRFTAGVAYLPAVTDLARSGPADRTGLIDRDRPAEPTGLAALRVLRGAVDGPLVAVLTSAVAAPPAADDPAAVLGALVRRLVEAGTPAQDLRLLVLGWAVPTPAPSTPSEPPGPVRWHTPAEVSAAALAVLGDPAPARLGVLRPWADRPR